MMKSKPVIFIVSIIGIVLLVIGIGLFANKAAGPSKYDDFAKALKTEGATFFGAFWCSHCQATKALFGGSKQYLPYVECSKADRSQTQVCLDNKIESYPSWRFKNGITVDSTEKSPIVCNPRKDGAVIPGEPEICKNAYSTYGKVWIFPNHKFSILTEKEPVHSGDNWIFSPESFATGEIPLEFLAKQINFNLPQ